MSSPDRTLVLSNQAQADYEDILSHTFQQWGEPQHDRYATLLNDAFLMLRQNPAVGHRSRQLPDPYRILPVGRHLLIYRVTETMLYVVRMLHERMDIRRHVTQEDRLADADATQH